MESRVLFICALSYFVQNAFTYPHNLGHTNFANGYTSNHQNIYNYPNSIGTASNGLALPRNAASSLASANIGHNNIAAPNINFNRPNSFGNTYLQNKALSNSAASASGLGNINSYTNLASSRLNTNNLAHNILGNGLGSNIGSLATSSATAQSLARNIAGSRNAFSNLAANKVASNAAAAYSAGNLGRVSLGNASTASEIELEDDVGIDCPDGMEMIGYVSFEGYLPVEGTVKVADNVCDSN